jgi:hypothetical protein
MARRPIHGMSVLVVPLAALLVMAACSSAPAPAGSGSAQGSQPGSADSATVAAATTILQAANLADAGSLGALEGIRFTDAGTQAAANLLKAGATGDALWAATYVYGSSGADPGPLKPIAIDASATPTVRAMAAAGLLGAGDIAGFDPLVVALGGSDEMDGADPAGTIWEFAGDVLERYTHTGLGPTLAASDAERVTIQATWKTWLDTNKAHLHFDSASHLWVIS